LWLNVLRRAVELSDHRERRITPQIWSFQELVFTTGPPKNEKIAFDFFLSVQESLVWGFSSQGISMLETGQWNQPQNRRQQTLQIQPIQDIPGYGPLRQPVKDAIVCIFSSKKYVWCTSGRDILIFSTPFQVSYSTQTQF
jgi:hypothetical protein